MRCIVKTVQPEHRSYRALHLVIFNRPSCLLSLIAGDQNSDVHTFTSMFSILQLVLLNMEVRDEDDTSDEGKI